MPGRPGAVAARSRGSAPTRVALALGSGGARGYAHIGVIEALRTRGYDIVGIAGSSMGALVGGLQAAGRLDEFADWAKSLTQRTILRLLDPSISAAGVMRAEKILDAVRDILGPVSIEQLPIPYTAVATDLLAGKSVWFPGVHRDSGGDRPTRSRRTPARRWRHPGSAADRPYRRGQRRPDYRGEPQRQRGRSHWRRSRPGVGCHRRVVEPHGAQHLRAAGHRRRPVAVGPADRAGRVEPVRRGYLVRRIGPIRPRTAG